MSRAGTSSPGHATRSATGRITAGHCSSAAASQSGSPRRRSGCNRHDHGSLHVVSAWASGQGLGLGQRAVDGKSNEIAAIPALRETLHLEGCIVTLDAMGCQRDIAAQIRAKGADYLLVLK